MDVSWHADIAEATARDDLDAAVDITAVASAVRHELAARPRVRVEKPHPAGLGADAESVELALTRENAMDGVP